MNSKLKKEKEKLQNYPNFNRIIPMYEEDENSFLINRIFVAATRTTRTAERQDRKPFLWQWHK